MPRLERHKDFLRVIATDGRVSDYHWFWLRHHCPRERHPQTAEPTLCASRVPLDVHPLGVELEERGVSIVWSRDREPSRYTLEWLSEHSYATERDIVPAPPSDVARYEIELDGNRLPRDFRERLEAHGAIIARGSSASPDPESTERLIDQIVASGLRVIETHFGRVEDLRTDNTTNTNNDQLGYTDAPIDLHTDQPFLAEPPRYQLLHCVREASSGGDSLLADARAAARWLRAHDAEAYEILTTVPVRFHRKQRAFERVIVSPILETTRGELIRVRHSYFTMAPQRIAFERMPAFYRAYQRFVGLIEEHRVSTRLLPGDVLLYDNHRMLHGRTGFRGARWVRGVYFDP